MYIDYEYYTALYDDLDEAKFFRLVRSAGRIIDSYTATADGVRKLKVAFPTDPEDAETVKLCTAQLVHMLHQIEQAQEAAATARGYTETDNGLQGKVVSSISAGNESVSFSTSAMQGTFMDKAISDMGEKQKLLYATVREYLSGVPDNNGVNLLYTGPYRV